METPVLSRPLTRNGSVGNPCGLHRGQWVWHNSSSCVDRGTVALFFWRIGRRRLDHRTQNETILAVTKFEERHGKREARRRAMTIRHLLERKGQCLWTIGPNTTVRDAICRNG